MEDFPQAAFPQAAANIPLLERVAKLEAEIREMQKNKTVDHRSVTRRLSSIESTLGLVAPPEPVYDSDQPKTAAYNRF